MDNINPTFEQLALSVCFTLGRVKAVDVPIQISHWPLINAVCCKQILGAEVALWRTILSTKSLNCSSLDTKHALGQAFHTCIFSKLKTNVVSSLV